MSPMYTDGDQRNVLDVGQRQFKKYRKAVEAIKSARSYSKIAVSSLENLCKRGRMMNKMDLML